MIAPLMELATKVAKVSPSARRLTNSANVNSGKFVKNTSQFQMNRLMDNMSRLRQSPISYGSDKQQNISSQKAVQQSSFISQQTNSLDSKQVLSFLSKMSGELERIRTKLESENTLAVKFSRTSQSAKDLSELKKSSTETNAKLEKINQSLADSSLGNGGSDNDLISSTAAGALGGAAAGGIARAASGAARAAGGVARSAASLGSRAISALGTGARLPSYLAGLGIDTIAGGFGVGDEEIDEEADEENWKKMGILERIQSGSARGIENIGEFIGLSNMSRAARASRVRSESQYFNNRAVENLNRMMTNGGGGMNADIQRLNEEFAQRNVPDTTNTGDDMSFDYTKYPITGKAETEPKPQQQSAVPTGRISEKVQQNMNLVENALREQGITDPNYIAAVKGNIMKESGGESISERMNYGGSSNERIRSIFGDRAAKYTNAELDAIKGDPEKMGELMYGADTDLGRKMGNTEAGEGYKYRGRGFIQMTGKTNYSNASQALFGDDRLVKNPDLLNDPEIAAKASAWYMKSGQENMAQRLGIDTSKLTQDQANLLATSQIAGRAITPGQGYLGKENLDKVTQNAALFANASTDLIPQPRETGNIIQAMGSNLQTTKEQQETGGGAPTIINNNTTNNTSAGGGGGSQQAASIRNEENTIIRMQNMMAAGALS